MPLQLLTPATQHALTLAEAKLHLRVDVTDDDALITALIAAAEADAEHLTGRALLPQQWRLTLDQFADRPATFDGTTQYRQAVLEAMPQGIASAAAITLQRPPVTAVNSVQYVDATTGTVTTLASSEYQLAAASDYTARLFPAYGKAWPATRAQPEAVQIVFTAGYADAASVPEPIKAWLRLRIGALNENRQAWTQGTHQALNRNEFLDFLLDRYRTWTF